jgi:hypothetical protein
MSNDCQKREVLKSGSFGPGNCEKECYVLKTAAYTFTCALCGARVIRGDVYMMWDSGRASCLCQMPTRKLIPVAEYKKNTFSKITYDESTNYKF